MVSLRGALGVWLAAGWWTGVVANTEAIVFDASEWVAQVGRAKATEPCLILGQERSFVLPLDRTRPTSLDLCLSDQSARSALSNWLSSVDRFLGLAKRTARLSWPASSPTDFAFSLHSTHLRLTASPSSVPFPSHANVNSASHTPLEVRFNLLVEPAHFGFLPASCLPLLGTIIGLLALLWATGLPGRAVRLVDRLGDGVAEERAVAASSKAR